jgi:mannose-1-phosphate guanylyltransferase/mannose-6-phosphate isomerase
MTVYPVILAGGSGTRLWPMSRESWPKQFLPLLGELSPFQATLERLRGIEGCKAATVIASAEHRFLVKDQLAQRGETVHALYLEPCGRSTAPAVTLAAYELLEEDPEAVMLVLPADHDIPDAASFAECVQRGLPAAASGRLVIFGIQPRWAETGYGYIERGNPLASAPGCSRVASFVEKPELEIAQRLAASGRHFWNSGMFLFGARAFIEEIERLEPELAQLCRKSVVPAQAGTQLDPRLRGGDKSIDNESFSACKSISIDHAVLERTTRAAMVPASFSWSDIGSWEALWDRTAKDEHGNESRGDVQLHDVSGSLIRAHHRLVVGIGLEDLVVVETPDAVLVARRSESQRVREAVEQLKAQGRGESRSHRRVARPWGTYEDIDQGDRFRVKRITVAPGEKLSLQYHHHRAEHWIIVSGTARVTRGEREFLLTENQSVYIEVGQVHRLENPGKVPLQLIEVQIGGYLGEDDIVRLEDVYQRVPAASTRPAPEGAAS